MRSPVSPARARRAKPHFWWRGTLIILPALLLAAAGLYSLRQDRPLAEHDAAERARKIALDLVEQASSQILRFDAPGLVAADRQHAFAEEEPIYRLTRSPLVETACLLHADGRLAYPPPLAPFPTPEPLDPIELTGGQQDHWLTLEAVLQAARADPRAVEARLRAFVAAQPPERFTALAKLRSAAVLARTGRPEAATNLLQTLLPLPPDLLGETGIPLRLLAELQLATVLPDLARDEVANRICGQLIAEPTPLSPAFVEHASRLTLSTERWREVLAGHEKARDFHAALSVKRDRRGAAPSPSPMRTAGSSLRQSPDDTIFLEQPVEGGRWILAISSANLRESMQRWQRSIAGPAHFELGVWLGSQSLLQPRGEHPPLAAASLPIRLLRSSSPLRVEVSLADPAAFYQRQRTRTLRLGALIAAAAGTVLLGFFAAWRAFRQQQQLAELKTDFVSSVSHELRSPIASVRLMAEELEQSDPPTIEKLQQYHRFIGQECRRLSAVIENVLDFSRSEQGREEFAFKPVDLGSLVRETVQVMRPGAGDRGIHLDVVESGGPRAIEADGRALQRLLVNLLDNAIKHSPQGSSVTVGLEFQAASVLLWVEDDGPGIPPHEQERIFEQFHRLGSELRREAQGVGLGLWIVRNITAAHRGRVRLRSDPGTGSRFTIELPLGPAVLPHGAEVPA